LFVFTGSVTNTGDVVLTNVFVVSSQPNANTPLLGPIELAPGESEEFKGSYTVTAGSDPATDTVTAQGTDTCQARTVSSVANCSGTTAVPTITSVLTGDGTVTIRRQEVEDLPLAARQIDAAPVLEPAPPGPPGQGAGTPGLLPLGRPLQVGHPLVEPLL
jgi:hypothetical protein